MHTCAVANAFVAGYANNAPAILTGPIGDLKATGTRTRAGPYGPTTMTNAPQQPTSPARSGFQIGSATTCVGPGYFDIDLGLGKTFPIYEDRVNLKFRCDAFNALNHPNFNSAADSTSRKSERHPFGTHHHHCQRPRVLQGALRLEF